jgi:hypothetical protein
MSRPNRALMITDWKQAWLAKMSVCGLQEELLFSSKSCRSLRRFNASTYKSSDLLIKTDCRLTIEIKESLLRRSIATSPSVQPCLGHTNPWPRAIQGHQRPFPVSHLWNNRSPWIPQKGRSSSPGRKRPE